MVTDDQYQIAKEVIHWHTFSDKTSDPKPADMSIEAAESIVFQKEFASQQQ